MKIALALVAVSFAGLAFKYSSTAVQMNVETNASKVEWAATKKTGYHQGIMKVKSGNVQVEGGKLVGGKFVIDVTSINATDFENPVENNFVKHLKSKDFLETETYPEATFEITKVDYKDEKNVVLNGTFTMKNVSLPLSFPATINNADEKRFFGFAHFTFDRTLWNVMYDTNRASKDVNIGVYLFAVPAEAAK
ncbi:YceI family protein [Aridibaculum aurantiacum]|uniref:YceI family protein n=1 Tax=Aridibaculum aurantiacum TaxID=2810307 RepID=UPI001A95870D|nr:YceI family protein [Aridibaculum aurantiacum]